MTLVFLTGDLMAASRVEGAARRCGATLKTVAEGKQAIACCAGQPVAAILVDLSTASLNIAALVRNVRSATCDGETPQIVAFGPHVHEALLAAAEAAGCDQVISRGQFFAQTDAIFAQFAGNAS